MKQPDFAKWYFYQLLKDYEGEQLYLNELGYVYGNEEKTNEIVKNNPGYVVKIFEEKMVNELKIREGANKRGNSSRLTQSFHFFMFEPIFSPVNALNQPI
nr:hypothetical protein [Escherichia coli]